MLISFLFSFKRYIEDEIMARRTAKYNEKDLLRHVEDGCEYLTVRSTGRSGMSQRGLARFIDKHNTSIVYWVDKVRKADPMDNSLPEPLKPFAGKPLTLMGYSDPSGRDILEDIFCAALIEYFAQYAQDADSNDQAKKACSFIKSVGMRNLIQLKTGWRPQWTDSELENFWISHQERVTARTRLKDKDRVELMNAVKEWQIKKKCSRKIYAQVHDELNKVVQSLTSQEIKRRNGLVKSALIRDYYDTEPLIDYGSLSRVATNLIRCDIHPIEAINLAAALYFSPERIPQEVPLIENIHKVTKLLEAKRQERQLKSQEDQHYLPTSS
ncbi:hypothetical protein [Limnoraphis robusta]|uniref:hypothetical protein n=1 Tax=Limnoraphis robusta TaxID=1118279 RepID=UPI002B1FC9AC|nr:hypothetical protein [Limnoraphis robusta]MEA5499542.1 hypothetical protein [Limnoraphis robusta BA-68 BA1]